MISNSSMKSARCIGRMRSRIERRSSASSAKIISRIASSRSSAKNMCSVRHSPMPSASNRSAPCGRLRGCRHWRARRCRAPRRPRRAACWKFSPSAGREHRARRPASASPAVPSTVITSPSRNTRPSAAVRVPALRSSRMSRGADDAGQAKPAGDHRGVAGHAAALGQHRLGRVHAADVLGRGLAAHQDAGFVLRRRRLGGAGGEHDLAGRRPGRGGDAAARSRRARPPGRPGCAGARAASAAAPAAPPRPRR